MRDTEKKAPHICENCKQRVATKKVRVFVMKEQKYRMVWMCDTCWRVS